MDVIMLVPSMLSSQNGLDYGRHRGWAMDRMLSSNYGEANVLFRPRAGQKRMQAKQGLV